MSDATPAIPALFHTTQWSMILSAAEDSGNAMERLCRSYWRPLYGYARRAGRTGHDAEDLVQGFLAKVIEKQWLRTVKRDAGPFRRYLQVAFKCYMLDEYDRSRAQKRGGGAATVPLDADEAEAFFARELATTDTPETAYERAWALEVFARARKALRDECAAAGRAEAHDALESGESYPVIAERLGMSVSAITSFAFRVRRRLQEMIRAEILQTVNSHADLEEEVAAMLRALSTGGG
jgi:RNA polymerase sigma-70 factor (ECF subfamily)